MSPHPTPPDRAHPGFRTRQRTDRQGLIFHDRSRQISFEIHPLQLDLYIRYHLAIHYEREHLQEYPIGYNEFVAKFNSNPNYLGKFCYWDDQFNEWDRMGIHERGVPSVFPVPTEYLDTSFVDPRHAQLVQLNFMHKTGEVNSRTIQDTIQAWMAPHGDAARKENGFNKRKKSQAANAYDQLSKKLDQEGKFGRRLRPPFPPQSFDMDSQSRSEAGPQRSSRRRRRSASPRRRRSNSSHRSFTPIPAVWEFPSMDTQDMPADRVLFSPASYAIPPQPADEILDMLSSPAATPIVAEDQAMSDAMTTFTNFEALATAPDSALPVEDVVSADVTTDTDL